MEATELEKALRAIVDAAAAAASINSWPASALQGIAFYDLQRDERVRALASFPALIEALRNTPLVKDRLGDPDDGRVALQLVYEYFKAIGDPRVDESVVSDTLQRFMAELAEPNWITRGLANLRNFSCHAALLELGDGVSIRGRNLDDLAALGFSVPMLDRLLSDWGGFGSSSFVIVAESAIPKNGNQPQNLISLDSATVWTKAMRAMGALRLVAPGDISFGTMWTCRIGHFNLGLGGITSLGYSTPAPGSQYAWTEEIGTKYSAAYSELAKLEQVGYGRAPGNLDLALRSFMATYDRWPLAHDSRVLDSITALEAVLGSGTEIAFKLAFRVATLLAADDHERVALLSAMKGFYDARSAIIHGARLKKAHQERLSKTDELRDLVRRLLRAFVALGAGEGHEYGKAFFEKHLDATLVSAPQRDKLRRTLGLLIEQSA